MPTPSRTARQGRLFPSEEHGTYSLSLQGSRNDHHCAPNETLPFLEDYEAVEAVIYGPGRNGHGMLGTEDLRDLDLPDEICAKFCDIGIGVRLTWEDVAALRARLDQQDADLRAALRPSEHPAGDCRLQAAEESRSAKGAIQLEQSANIT